MYKRSFRKRVLLLLTSCCLLSNTSFAVVLPKTQVEQNTNKVNAGISHTKQLRHKAVTAAVEANSKEIAKKNEKTQEPEAPNTAKEIKTLQDYHKAAGFNSLVNAVDGVFNSLDSRQAFTETHPASGEQTLTGGVWLSSGFSFGNAKYQGTKSRPKTTSFTLGYDTEVSQSVSLGAFASIINLQNSSKSLKMKQKGQYFLGGVYGSSQVKNLNLSSAFAFGNGSDKCINNSGATSSTTKENNLAYGAKLKAAYHIKFDDLTLAPMVAVRYFAIANGADDASNNAKRQNLATDVGMEFIYNLEADNFIIKPRAVTGYRFDMINTPTLNAKDSRKGKFFAGAGLGAQNQSFDFSLNASSLYAKNFQDYSVFLKALAKF